MVKCESIIGAAHAMQQTLTSETKPGGEGSCETRPGDGGNCENEETVKPHWMPMDIVTADRVM